MSPKQETRLVVDSFKFYVIEVSKNKNFVFRNSDKKQVKILRFISELKSISNSTELGEDYCKQYFEFQFNRFYKTSGSLKNNKNVQLDWIIGKKALSIWNNRSVKQKQSTSFFVRKGLKEDVKLKYKVNDIYNDNYKTLVNRISTHEEEEKKRFYGENKGFINCQISTTLFNHKSKLCSLCKFSKECKGFLKKNMYNIFVARGYN